MMIVRSTIEDDPWINPTGRKNGGCTLPCTDGTTKLGKHTRYIRAQAFFFLERTFVHSCGLPVPGAPKPGSRDGGKKKGFDKSESKSGESLPGRRTRSQPHQGHGPYKKAAAPR